MSENLTQLEIVEQIDFERRENNAKFIDDLQTVRLMNRAVDKMLLEPGVRTVPELQNITPIANTIRYALDPAFKEVISLWSGEGTSTGIEFEYKPIKEFNSTIHGYVYTFNEDGYIDVKFPDISLLPDSTLKLRFWSRYTILDQDGVTKKEKWENDEDKSLIPSFDEYYIMWTTARILKREGKKEWTDYLAEAKEMIALLKEQPKSKTSRPRRAFGHFQFNP